MKLAFPRNWGESNTLEFADGVRTVPEYLADLMGAMDVSGMTYQQALDRVNSGMVSERIGGAQSAAIAQHFERDRDGRHR